MRFSVAQVSLIGDSLGAILGFDALCRVAPLGSRYGSDNSINEEAPPAPRPNPLISISDGSGNDEAEEGPAPPRTSPPQAPPSSQGSAPGRKPLPPGDAEAGGLSEAS